MSRALENKVAVITGAGSGIGRATAQLFAERGARLLLAARREAPLQDLVRSLGEDRAAYLCIDVTKQQDNERLFDEAQRKFRGCDIFVASAGAEGVSELIENYPIDVFDEVMAVNVRGVFLGLQSAMPMMRTRGGGSIVIVSSIAGIKARNTHNSAYVASKHAEVGLTRTAAMEGAPHNIRVNVCCPARPTQRWCGGSKRAARLARRRRRARRSWLSCRSDATEPRRRWRSSSRSWRAMRRAFPRVGCSRRMGGCRLFSF